MRIEFLVVRSKNTTHFFNMLTPTVADVFSLSYIRTLIAALINGKNTVYAANFTLLNIVRHSLEFSLPNMCPLDSRKSNP
jgi:hypothetical protein